MLRTMATSKVSNKTYEFITVVHVDDRKGSLPHLAELAETELENLIADRGVATVHQYFVRALANSIQIGLRFRGISSDHVEETGLELATDAVTAALEDDGQAGTRTRVASTLLAGV